MPSYTNKQHNLPATKNLGEGGGEREALRTQNSNRSLKKMSKKPKWKVEGKKFSDSQKARTVSWEQSSEMMHANKN